MNIESIRSDAEYREALKEPEPGTEEANRFEILVTLIEAYEAQHFPLAQPEGANRS